MFRRFTTVVIFFSLLLFANYSSATKMKSSWKNPSATASNLQFKKVLVVVIIRQEFTRKVAEDKAVRVIESGGTTKAVPSYTILSTDDFDNKEAAKSKIAGMDFDGAVVMRAADSKDESKYDPDEYDEWDKYNDFWWLWGGLYNSMNRDDTKVYIETMLYSLKDQKLIWSGITETKNPKNPAVVVGEIAEETTKYLQKEGLIAKKEKINWIPPTHL